MVGSGIISILCMVILFILILTGWFPRLAHDIGFSQTVILSFLSFSTFLSFLPSEPNGMVVQVHPGILSVTVLFFVFLRKVRQGFFFFIFSFSLFLGSLLFLWHEVTHVETDWTNPSFRLVMALVLIIPSLFLTKYIQEQLFILLLSLMVTHGWVLFFHREVLKPLVIGYADYLDTVWMVLLGWIVLYYGLRNLHGFLRSQFRSIKP